MRIENAGFVDAVGGDHRRVVLGDHAGEAVDLLELERGGEAFALELVELGRIEDAV